MKRKRPKHCLTLWLYLVRTVVCRNILRTLLFSALAMSATAQEMPRMTTWEKAWVASSGAFLVAQFADTTTSMNNVGRETNPLFGSTFTGKDAAIKLGVTGAIIGVQYFVIRRYPHGKAAKVFSLVNIGGAAVTGFTAARNERGNQ